MPELTREAVYATFGALHETACSAAARLLDSGFKK
jgi:hypothetical protein